MEYALQMFEQAIQLDLNFALAHAGIAHLCGLKFEVRDRNQNWIKRRLAACDRATALAPDLPEVLIPSSANSIAMVLGIFSAGRISPPATMKKPQPSLSEPWNSMATTAIPLFPITRCR
jgi:hypothetical protein